MVRHESAEALGAIGIQGDEDGSVRSLLRKVWGDEAEETVVRETAEVAVGRLEWEASGRRRAERLRDRLVLSQDFGHGRDAEHHTHLKANSETDVLFSDFSSIDPAPPLPQLSHQHSISELQSHLLDTTLPLFSRYRAMFALRDLASPPDLPTAIPAIHALASGFSDGSALFRHEIAFIFGQLSHPVSIPSLISVLSNKAEKSMVRHEAAEALGGLAGEEEGVEEVLRGFLKDEEEVVRDSVIVALDMAAFEKGGEREYAVVPDLAGGEGLSPFVKVKT